MAYLSSSSYSTILYHLDTSPFIFLNLYVLYLIILSLHSCFPLATCPIYSYLPHPKLLTIFLQSVLFQVLLLIVISCTLFLFNIGTIHFLYNSIFRLHLIIMFITYFNLVYVVFDTTLCSICILVFPNASSSFVMFISTPISCETLYRSCIKLISSSLVLPALSYALVEDLSTGVQSYLVPLCFLKCLFLNSLRDMGSHSRVPFYIWTLSVFTCICIQSLALSLQGSVICSQCLHF